MAKLSLSTRTDGDAVERRGAGAALRHAATAASWTTAPAAGTTTVRFGTSPPVAVVSTRSQLPSVSLNATAPRTESGRVIA
jgi:hypothetical protein